MSKHEFPRPARAALTLAMAQLLAASLACQTLIPMSASEKFIQGSWGWGQDLGNGFSSYLVWTFDAGSFTAEGYPPLYQSGHYHVVAEDGDTLTLKLTDQAGDWPTDDREMLVVIDQAAGSLTIDNNGPFSPSTPFSGPPP
jgi:hypothetical protein